ncbi:hypothetical protein JAAARDRAFT_52872 [Jaapia argillacea MUCL 33604]|uniref:ABC transporter domain-containing protein n=1 Tax=Jaapia argillacea MUCL 33604 TaxID=933084 RepID=A0A067QQL0_9AGAM|nr:hypothetical protein JAAARDRAFT_52872 [Jaapia argillacea MUCL 33604]
MHLPDPKDTLYDIWLASRSPNAPNRVQLAPGAQRPLTIAKLSLAGQIIARCGPGFFTLVWGLHPIRTLIMLALNVARGAFPALRGYSQALIINEVQSSISSGSFTWSHLLYLLGTEFSRMVLETAIDSFATLNENLVYGSARFLIEYRQMEQQLRLDVPTLSDPTTRDLLHESDLFVRSFAQAGIGGFGFGLLSPLDFVRVLTLLSELASHVFVLSSLTAATPSSGTSRTTQLYILAFSLITFILPHIVAWLRCPDSFNRYDDGGLPYTPQEARNAERQEKMRNLAHSDPYRPEVLVWGLGPWILQGWSKARRAMLGLDSEHRGTSNFIGQMDLVSSVLAQINFNFADLMMVVQNIPLMLVLQQSSGALGSLALYRNSVQQLVFTIRQLFTTTRMGLQSIFLMGAFCAAMEIEPLLAPKEDDLVQYVSHERGMKIEARNLCYTYPGSKQPSLSNVNFKLEAGERLAIVGHNGSGKSTLAKVLLRILDFDSGELLVNDVSVRHYNPHDFHNHVSTVFQGFSKFNSTLAENVGIGFVDKLKNTKAIEHAVKLAGATRIVESLPRGLKTRLDTAGADPFTFPSLNGSTENDTWASSRSHQGLSGGEWQHIALSRAFMRAHRPEVDLLVFDEPTSSLDAHAQNRIFDTIDDISRRPSGDRTKSVIFITHRLSTVRRADKVAFMENGTIVEFGTHQELMRRNGPYAALYRASV